MILTRDPTNSHSQVKKLFHEVFGSFTKISHSQVIYMYNYYPHSVGESPGCLPPLPDIDDHSMWILIHLLALKITFSTNKLLHIRSIQILRFRWPESNHHPRYAPLGKPHLPFIRWANDGERLCLLSQRALWVSYIRYLKLEILLGSQGLSRALAYLLFL